MIAEEPRDLAYASRALEGSDITVDDLLALKLLRQDNDRLVINFIFLTQQDQAEIVRVATPHAAALADGYLQHREEIETILTNRGLPDVPATYFAYILIGCFSLDWDIRASGQTIPTIQCELALNIVATTNMTVQASQNGLPTRPGFHCVCSPVYELFLVVNFHDHLDFYGLAPRE